MRSLFSFNPEYVSAVAGGRSDGDTLFLFGEAYTAMAEEIQAAVGSEYQVLVDGEGPYVLLTREQVDEEFGTLDDPAKGSVRAAFHRAVPAAERAFTGRLSD